MKLKKIFSILSILVVSLSIALQSCGKKDEPKNNNNKIQVENDGIKNNEYSSKIQGKWLVVSYTFDVSALAKIYGVDSSLVDKAIKETDVSGENFRIQITSNAIISLKNNEQITTYKLNGKKIEITSKITTSNYPINSDDDSNDNPSNEDDKDKDIVVYDDVEIKSLDNNTLVIEAKPSSGKDIPIIVKLTRIK